MVSLVTKLVIFALGMIVLPIVTFFVARNTVFQGVPLPPSFCPFLPLCLDDLSAVDCSRFAWIR